MKALAKGRRFVVVLLLFFVCLIGLIVTAPTGMRCHTALEVNPQLSQLIRPTPPDDYFSKEESSFLIFPEWYIVFSADEYGAFLKTHRPSQFSYFAAIKQYWQSYACVTKYTQAHYEFNNNNHLVSIVIGISYSVEYGLKGSYEKTIGRVNEWLSGNTLVEEDVFAQKVAAEYGTFLHTQAWFLFPFGEKLTQLWRETSLFGPHLLRKWERKIILSTEYLGKAIYATGLKKATYSTIGKPDLTTELWTSTLPAAIATSSAEIIVLAPADEQTDFIQVPRYEAFKKALPILFDHQVHIYEVGGNHLILSTVLAPQDWQPTTYPVLFEMKYVSDHSKKRVGLVVPVTQLDSYLEELSNQQIELEHIYDY